MGECFACGIEDVVSYYDGKTGLILERYGPGPRVHYHTGLVEGSGLLDSASVEELRQRLVAAQERMLYYAASIWDASSTLCGDVLDVGCGLGGGSIFWAQECGAQVTAVTCVSSHLDLVERFTALAGVTSRVQTVLCDALAVPGESCFDAAVAIDSSCHLARREWFARLASLLRPGGRIYIADCFLGRRKYEEPFNSYWHTRIGTIGEYIVAAEEANLRLESVDDISRRTEHFWIATVTLMEAEARERTLGPADIARREASVRMHTLMRRGLVNGGLHYVLMSFSKA